MTSLDRAFDELRFGPRRTLNLRARQPTAAEATAHCEQWLRQQQVDGAHEVLVITGRGLGSVDGVSPVRAAVAALFPSLRRRNVIREFREHTAGSFAVTLAPVHALFEAPRRRRERNTPRRFPAVGANGLPRRNDVQSAGATPAVAELAALEPDTRALLAELARQQLQQLGVQDATEAMVQSEMLHQFTALSPALGNTADAEARLQQAVLRAIEELDAR